MTDHIFAQLRKAALATDEAARQAARGNDRPRLTDYVLSVLGLAHGKQQAAATRVLAEALAKTHGAPAGGGVWFSWVSTLHPQLADQLATDRRLAAAAVLERHSAAIAAGATIVSGQKPGPLTLPSFDGDQLTIEPVPLRAELTAKPDWLGLPGAEEAGWERFAHQVGAEIDRIALERIAQCEGVTRIEAAQNTLWEALSDADAAIQAAARGAQPGAWIAGRDALKLLRTTARGKGQEVIMPGGDLCGRRVLVADAAGRLLAGGLWGQVLIAPMGPGLAVSVTATADGRAKIEVALEVAVGLLRPDAFAIIQVQA